MSKTKILYVDDEPVNLKLFKINFRKKYEILTAQDGFSGLTELENNSDTFVVISDMKMPNMNGLEFIKRAKEKFPEKKFYILTGFDISEEIKLALKTGLILKYFSKPFNIKDIEKTLVEVIENS